MTTALLFATVDAMYPQPRGTAVHYLSALVVLVWLLAACAAPADISPSPVPLATSADISPSAVPLATQGAPAAPTQLATPLPVPAVAVPSSTPSAVIPTPAARTSTGGRAVTFNTEDGVKLGGTLYGSGPRAVILSNIGSGAQSEWQELPDLLAARGYLVITYDWRGFGASGGAQDYVACVQDLAAAIELARAQGATRIILAGGSLGGIASIKNATIPELAGLVVMSSPRNAPGLLISDAELAAIAAPKLLVGSVQDTIIPYSETEAMYRLAPAPKTLQSFPGAAHGTDILKSADHDALVKRLVDFMAASLPPPSQVQTQFAGSYLIAPDRFISVFVDGDALSYRDFRTGRIGRLAALAEDTFGVGLGPGAQSSLEARVIFTRDAAGHVSGFSWKPVAASVPGLALAARRLEGFFTEQEIRFRNGDVSLAGTVVLPAGAGPHPALIVISGSNPASRRDAYPRTRAQYLAWHGIAVLLYDKRGVGDSTGRYQEYASDSNIEDLSGDAQAGIELLKTRPELDPHRIGIFGSSQAGWIAPRIAARSADVAFMLLLSGPTVSPSQQDYYRGLLGQSLSDGEITRRVLAYGAPDFDPLPYIVKTKIPSLWIFGGRDENIPTYASIAILDKLTQSGQHNHTYLLYPGANHSLYDVNQPGGTVLGLDDAILAWLLQAAKLPHP